MNLELRVATATAILKGEEKADPEQQKLISTYFRKSQRELFTDFPPEEKAQSAGE
jgi:hypothetical protein